MGVFVPPAVNPLPQRSRVRGILFIFFFPPPDNPPKPFNKEGAMGKGEEPAGRVEPMASQELPDDRSRPGDREIARKERKGGGMARASVRASLRFARSLSTDRGRAQASRRRGASGAWA